MSGASKVREVAASNGWTTLIDEPRRLVVFRWLPGVVRREVCFIFDAAGRITAVSTWENARTSIDQDAGCRKRAEQLLTAEAQR